MYRIRKKYQYIEYLQYLTQALKSYFGNPIEVGKLLSKNSYAIKFQSEYDYIGVKDKNSYIMTLFLFDISKTLNIGEPQVFFELNKGQDAIKRIRINR